MIKPDFIGPKSLYLNPASDQLVSADLAAIDTDYTVTTVIQPYAYTATVADNYDAFNFLFDNAGADLLPNRRIAVGLFLSPQNDKGNLLFQVSGKVDISGGAVAITKGSFFFGRKSTNNTVVSTKVAAANSLALYRLLECKQKMSYISGTTQIISESCEEEVFTLNLSGGFVYCFGYFLDNMSGAIAQSLRGHICLSVRKYASTLDVFRPMA